MSVHAFTGALKSFFKDLPEPLIPSSHHNSILEATSEYDGTLSLVLSSITNAIVVLFCFRSVIMDANKRFAALKDVLSKMPQHNLAVFKRLMFHLNR